MSTPAIAFILIRVKSGLEHEVTAKLDQISDIKESHIVFGVWDLVAKIETPNLQKLDYIVTQIRKIAGVEQTTTLLAT